ncbi:hypothetical protein C8R34_10264 [Nitrosomonas sp. Nm84]|uniref:hypothetical protein n=1 Tax=Nitrosomonas sp. Nm84 TaxID=200124 RepID=UPI000D8E151C|nr:hypothetical protein [Nitrosomonas sp. Nm84]PXW90752.1 hypothetical protein C8R34_10264 [Nitrosomonas sp. Nm84]
MAISAIHVESNDRLEITINNTRPVALTDLTLSLLSVGHQFEKFIETELRADVPVASELLVKEVRSGSIVFELVAQALPLIPLFWQGGALLEWANYAKDTIHWLSGKLAQPPRNLTKNDLKQWHSILEPVAKDQGSQLNFTVADGGTVINQFFVNSAEANAAQNRIKRELGLLEEPSDSIHTKRVMTWYQAKFDNDSQTGNKALIESISPRPLRVVFDNNAVKSQMFEQGIKFSKPWHRLAYIVDVQVQTINGQPRLQPS